MIKSKTKVFHRNFIYPYLMFLYSLSFNFIFLTLSMPIFGDQLFTNDDHDIIRLEVVKSPGHIDLKRSSDILVKSFMDAYEDVPLTDLSSQFKSTRDVRRFYQDYFKEELEHFKQGHLYWIQAFVNEKLAGWATFELEKSEPNAAYMNLLIVAPEYQRKGVGKYLVFSIRSEELFPTIQTINLLIRKVNTQGYLFYRKLGFLDFDYQRSNFVDTSLLTGLRWTEIN